MRSCGPIPVSLWKENVLSVMTKLDCLGVIVMLSGLVCAAWAADAPTKRASAFCPPSLAEKAKSNAERYAWAADIQNRIIADAEPWLKMSDDKLWDLMFGSAITRSWMVWSNGHCPSCKKDVPMYNWQMAPFDYPWKVICPQCREQFPKNDFHKFYLSGLDEHGVFDPKSADRSLLFNVEHPDPADPLRLFGVDDGEGYVEGDKRWRFIGAYLIYGQWKRAVLPGIQRLAEAYEVTGDRAYAHKAGVLLDRVADLYPTFDYRKQGLVYEVTSGDGYVSIWHDACEETRWLVLAYDQVFEGLRQDGKLVEFLSRKSKQFKLDNPKSSFEDIQRNIEGGILQDALRNQQKIHSNYPRTDATVATIKAVLSWPESKLDVYKILDDVIETGTAVDGVTGEKGLANYTVLGVTMMTGLLGPFSCLDTSFLDNMLRRHPKLGQMFRFHIDTWCLGKYYPLSGDTGCFGQKIDAYLVPAFAGSPYVTTSTYSLLWQMYKLTGDVVLVQVLHKMNGGTVEDLPHELFADDPEAMQKAVREVIAKKGPEIRLGSVDKQEWHLAILRSGEGDDARALWLDYDSGGGHGHADGMNLGLFAKGLDLMPDFGYPQVQYGGWGSPRAQWYISTAAHNTVVVDGRNTQMGVPPPAGKTTLWADGKSFRAVRASGAGIINGQQFERTAAMTDIGDRDFYVLDILRVVGGTDHAKFQHSHFGQITTQGLSPSPCAEYGHGAVMRNFACDPNPRPGWSVDWKIEDRYKYLPPGSDIHLRYTDLTTGAQAITAEGWVVPGLFNINEEVWIPSIVTRRTADKPPLASTFVSVMEPYEAKSKIAGICRLPLETSKGITYPDPNVAVEIKLVDGRRDLILAADVESPLHVEPSFRHGALLVQPDWGARLIGEMCAIRLDKTGRVLRIALCRGRSVSVGGVTLKLRKKADFIEVSFDKGRAIIETGDAADVEKIMMDGRSCKWEKS